MSATLGYSALQPSLTNLETTELCPFTSTLLQKSQQPPEPAVCMVLIFRIIVYLPLSYWLIS